MKYAALLVAAALAIAGCGTTSSSSCAGNGKCAVVCSGACATGTCTGKCKAGAAAVTQCSGKCPATCPKMGASCQGTCPKTGQACPAATATAAAAGTAVAGATRGLATAVYVDQAPPIDGTLASPAWKQCPALTLGKVDSKEAGTLQTTAYVLFDKQNLYVGWECAEKETDKLVADATDRDGQVWSDDNVEIFLSPDGDKAFHFAVNSKGVLLDGRGDVNEADDATWNSGAVVKAAVEKGKGWTGTMSIPLKDLAARSGKDQKWLLNINRTKPVKDSDGGVTFTESSWSATGKSRYADATGWGKLTGVNMP